MGFVASYKLVKLANANGLRCTLDYCWKGDWGKWSEHPSAVSDLARLGVRMPNARGVDDTFFMPPDDFVRNFWTRDHCVSGSSMFCTGKGTTWSLLIPNCMKMIIVIDLRKPVTGTLRAARCKCCEGCALTFWKCT